MIDAANRTPNERALDGQHLLIEKLEAAHDQYVRLGYQDRLAAKRLARILGYERRQLRMLRDRVQRERERR